MQEPEPTALAAAIPTAFPAAQPDAPSQLTNYPFFIILLSKHFQAVTELNTKSLRSLISTGRVCWVWAVAVMRNLGYRCRGIPCAASQRAWSSPFAVPIDCTGPVGVLGRGFSFTFCSLVPHVTSLERWLQLFALSPFSLLLLCWCWYFSIAESFQQITREVCSHAESKKAARGLRRCCFWAMWPKPQRSEVPTCGFWSASHIVKIEPQHVPPDLNMIRVYQYSDLVFGFQLPLILGKLRFLCIFLIQDIANHELS